MPATGSMSIRRIDYTLRILPHNGELIQNLYSEGIADYYEDVR